VARKRDPLRGTAEIALAVGKVINRHKMARHFHLDITDTAFSFARKTAAIAAEAATDGVYVIRTSLPVKAFDDAATGVLQWTQRSTKKLDRIIAQLSVVEQDDHR
jgi:hypothetical protein